MTGKDFTDNKLQYMYYPEPTISKITPNYVSSGGGAKLGELWRGANDETAAKSTAGQSTALP